MSAATDTQNRMILAALQQGRAITPQFALRRFDCFRLAARIYELRKAGHHIITHWEGNDHKRWARYVLLHTARGERVAR
jgi:hypothetical protein